MGSQDDKRAKRERQIKERREAMPRRYRPGYDRAVRGKSLRAAVKAFCLECVYWKREEVRQCTCLTCPLYAERPYKLSCESQEGYYDA